MVAISRRSLLLAGAAFPASAFAQCVTDRFAVDACLGGVRGPSGPPGKTLDLNFMFPGTLDPRITFTRASTATYTDASGVIQTAAVNAPRWDYDPVTHALRGLLIEEQRTNYTTSSTNFGHATYATTALTYLPGQAGAPDGTATFTRMSEDGTTGSKYMIFGFGGVGAGQPLSISIYARAQQIRYLQLTIDDAGSNGMWATFDLQTGTISGPTATRGTITVLGAAIQAVGGGTYRCSISGSSAGVNLNRIVYGPSNVANPGWLPSYAGNAANGVLIWGAQIEQGAFGPTSYIGTTSAAVTRAQDICAIPPANMSPWYASPGGSWFAEFIAGCPPLSGRTPRLIANPSVAASATPLYFGQSGQIGQYDIASAIETGIGLGAVGSVNKAVCTWAPGAAKACVNAGAVASTAAMTTGYALLSGTGVGILSGVPTETMTGYIRRVQYSPLIWSDVVMQQVTT